MVITLTGKLSLIVLVIFILLTIAFWKTPLFKDEKVEQYFRIISSISIIFAFLGFILSTQQYEITSKNTIESNKNNEINSFITSVQTNWINVEQIFMNETPYLNSLYNELYNTNFPIIKLSIAQQNEIPYKEHAVLNILYQIIEIIVNTDQSELRKNYGWLVIFTQWSKSPKFQSNWNLSQHFYNPITQKFINNLINKNSKITESIWNRK